MIDRIIELAARRRTIVLGLWILAALYGWRAIPGLSLDALPDLGDPQVIVYSQWDRSPDLIDAHVTTPIVSSLRAAPRVKTVRGISDYGTSIISVVFQEGTDVYWARSRVSEYLSPILSRLPDGVRTELGPDATALGWVFQYVLVDVTGTFNLADLRSYQDWYLRYHLAAVPGVAEVATVGGYVRQYQVNVDPNRIRSHGLTIQQVAEAVRAGNRDVGGQVIESGGGEMLVRGLGSARSTADFEQIVVSSTEQGDPVRVRDVARVSTGAASRRGVIDFDGQGEAVSGVVIMRQGANALAVIDGVKSTLRRISPSLPSGLQVVPVYDRSELVTRAVTNARRTVLEVVLTTAAVTILFLWHLPSALVAVVTIPVAVLVTVLAMSATGIGANIMSLAGIAIAVGAFVDAVIVGIEQAHKGIEEWEENGRPGPLREVVLTTLQKVTRTSFFALLVIGVSFMPVLALNRESGRLFRPLVYAKSIAVFVTAGLVITLVPALRMLFVREGPLSRGPRWLRRAGDALLVGRVRTESQHLLHRAVISWYRPVVGWSLSHGKVIGGGIVLSVVITVPVWLAIGSELMPDVDEGVLLYMPTTSAGIAIGEAQRLLQITDRVLKGFPEVERVLGKAGRADTATDPAPLSMFETVVVLKPTTQWPRVETWYSGWAPEWARVVLRRFTPDHASRAQLIARMNDALSFPGLSNTWSMPIRGRLDMLATGVRGPLGVKITARTPADLERVGDEVSSLLRGLPATRSAFAERFSDGRLLDIRWNREAMAAAGVSFEDAQAVVMYAIGGENVTTLLDGRERYPVNVRYAADFRNDPQALGRIPVPARGGRAQAALKDLCEIASTTGPTMIRNEDGLLTGYVYVDVSDPDLSDYVATANELLSRRLQLPAGTALSWAGQYARLAETRRQLWLAVALAAAFIVLLINVNTRSFSRTALVLLAVPFSAIGAIWAIYLAGYQMSVAVWVGVVALLGVDAETGVFMLMYLDDACERARREGSFEADGVQNAVVAGASGRVRPKLMTAATLLIGLIPVMWSTGAGAEITKRIAAPMIGGIVSSLTLELLAYPLLYQVLVLRRSSTTPPREPALST